MSVNIVIQEGGTSAQFTVDKLKTNRVGGGSCLFVPEDSIKLLDSKTLSQDGAYIAADEGYDGYKKVIVRGIGVATGKDGDGDYAQARTGQDGSLIVSKIPSAIEVTTNPTKITYTDGETIDFSGIVVKAKLETGGVYTDSTYPNGIIPVSELFFPVTQATWGGYDNELFSVINEILPGERAPFRAGFKSGESANDVYYWINTSNQPVYFCTVKDNEADNYRSAVFAKNEATVRWENKSGSTGADKELEYDSALEIYDYYDTASTGHDPSKFESPVLTYWEIGELAENHGNINHIPVRWVSPYTGDMLECTFNIHVTES